MGPRRTAMLLMLAAGQACAQGVPGQGVPGQGAPAPAALAQAESAKPIFLPPPLRWDHAMTIAYPALQQSATDFANLTGGIAFGMSPGQVNARLPEPYPAVSWNDLPTANEYPGEVRYLSVPIGRAGALRTGLGGCAGAATVVLLFNQNGLFRLSYRLTADRVCTDTDPAAQAIFARYVTIGDAVALSVRYRTGGTEVVDMTDPTAGDLIPVRWRQGTY